VVTPEEAQRLALIRYQLTLALQQVEQPPPMNGLSVLGFQDVLESFLYLAAEHLHAAVYEENGVLQANRCCQQ